MAAVDILIVILAGLIPITAASLYSLIDRTTSTVDTSQRTEKPPETGENAIPAQGAAAAEESRRDADADAAEDDHPGDGEQQSPDESASGHDVLAAVTIHHSPAPSAEPAPEAAR